MNQQQVYGMTLPLVTKADGSKFGKTEEGTIWLDPAKTSSYSFYQFWLNTADADVYNYLRYFTFIDPVAIKEIEASDKTLAERPRAQKILAREVTLLVHGKDGLEAAERITQALFSGELGGLTANDFEQLCLDGLPSSSIEPGAASLVESLVASGLASSNRNARELIANGAVSINGEKEIDVNAALSPGQALLGKYWLLKKGKKQFHLHFSA